MENLTKNEEANRVIPKDMLDLKVLQRLVGRYSKVAGFYAYSLDCNGEKIADIKGNADEISRLISLVGTSHLDSLFHRISDDDMEVQAMEDTQYPNIKIAGSSLHVDGVALVNWIIIAVLTDEEFANQPGAVAVSEFTNTISYNKLLSAVDVIRDITSMIVVSKLSVATAEAETRRSKFSEEETKASLKRVEATSEVVALLDNDNAIEEVMDSLVNVLGSYLGISTAMIVQTRANIETMDVVAQWTNTGVVSFFDQARRISKFAFVKTDKPQIISFDSDVSEEWREEMNNFGVTAVVVLPIRINNGIGMYSCFFDTRSNRRWAIDEVKFLYDAVKILENIITKRLQKNSLASSYASLEAVLDNIGSAIYVRDLETGRPLFSNKILKSTFASEIQDGTIDELFDTAIPINKNGGIFEINHIAKNRWYDLHYTYINWVDGRKASLCAVYDVTDKKNYQRRIEQQAYTDFLTGLYNRMCCERDLAMHIDTAKSTNTKGALLYLDLDDFKHINDGLGHQYGDVLLKAISHSLRRIEGIQNTCYRMGGDEFVIIIPPTSYENFEKIVKGIKDIFSKPWYLKDADYYCTMSMGIVEFPESGESVQDLIKKADIAMYEAKKGGKNRVAQYSDKIVSSSNKRLDMEKNMRDATTSGYKEFEVYYQPIIDVLSPNTPCIGAEALIRWNSVELGFISPSDFIPLAEYLGLINPIGNYVLKEACKSVKYWNENGHPEYKVNVNLSVVQLLQTDIVDIVKNTIEEIGINPANLTLEVTESLAINDMERMKKILNAIKTLGVKIALDDFGTGYSSLNHIREIPFDVIKVDQSFVRDLADDAYSQSFIKMVAELAETIGVNVCVEGIETGAQFGVLEGMKVKMVQGYYFDRPMTKENFESKYVINNL